MTRSSFDRKGDLPETLRIEILGLDIDGEMTARPLPWVGVGAPPVIFVKNRRRTEGSLSAGDQVLAQLKKAEDGSYEATILKYLDDAGGRVLGVFRARKTGGVVLPTDKKDRDEYFVAADATHGAEDGDLVVAERALPGPGPRRGKNQVRIAERLGPKDDPRLISLIAIHTHGIPTEFPAAALDETEKMAEPKPEKNREDLRRIPLVTIDGADARDFDDAVHAAPDEDPKNPGGWKILVAIADVSYYVRPGTALDTAALARGNSTYFADRVVPMLPERLSNDLCSLRPGVDRACLACHMRIDKDGRLVGYRFARGLMRSAARLTYEEVENAHLGYPDAATGPLVASVLQPLYRAYAVLKRAREARGALEIDLPERKAVIDPRGRITAIVPRQRLQSHQLIEEFMVLANVAAATALEDKDAPCLYRAHDPPAFDRLEATRDFLKDLGYSLPKTAELAPAHINRILKLSADRPDKDLIHTVLLRTQAQAAYRPDNNGHFGLALVRYAHFTSPIRRYADLVVHRSLVTAFGLGGGGLGAAEAEGMAEIATHISQTERRSMLAERDVMDRFTAQYLKNSVGQEFPGRINAVTRFGLFVILNETGADGIVPRRSLPHDYYNHDEKRHALVGKNSGRTFRLADPVVVRLLEADPLRGSTVFELVDSFGGPLAPSPQNRTRREARGKNRRGKKDGKRKPRGRNRR